MQWGGWQGVASHILTLTLGWVQAGRIQPTDRELGRGLGLVHERWWDVIRWYMIDLCWRQHNCKVLFLLRVMSDCRFSLLWIWKLRWSHNSNSLCFIRSVETHLIVEVNHLWNIRLPIIMLLNFSNTFDSLRRCGVSSRINWFRHGGSLIVYLSWTSPDGIWTHVGHFSPHIVLLEWIHHSIFQMLSHPDSILVKLTLVSWVIGRLFIIHRVITCWSATIWGNELPWRQIRTLSHIIVCVVITSILEIIDWG